MIHVTSYLWSFVSCLAQYILAQSILLYNRPTYSYSYSYCYFLFALTVPNKNIIIIIINEIYKYL